MSSEPSKPPVVRSATPSGAGPCASGALPSVLVAGLLLGASVGATGCRTVTGQRGVQITMRPAATEAAPPLRIEPNEVEAARLGTANEAIVAEDYDTALRVFRDLLSENPTLADAYTGMGEALERKGDLELAEPAYARALALDPKDFGAATGHGRVLEALGRVRDAIRAFQKAIAIRPRDVPSNVALSRLLLSTDQLEGAVAFGERAIKLDPDNGEAHLALARAYSAVGRGTDAIREYEAATELIEPPIEVMFALVNAYAEEKRYEEAANAAEALTRTAPSAAAFERLGWALFRLNRFEESDAAYRSSIALDELYWPALNGVGVNALNAWIKGGKVAEDPKRAEARSMLQRSLRANPDQPKVAALLLKYRL